MAFKLLKKSSWGSKFLGSDTICINKATLSFGKDYKDFLGNKVPIKIFIDREEKRVGFKPTDDKSKGFPIRWDNDIRGGISVNLQKKTGVKSGQRFIGKLIDGILVCENVEFVTSEEEKTKPEAFEIEE